VNKDTPRQISVVVAVVASLIVNGLANAFRTQPSRAER
jgi:hypothetical protein